MYQMKGGGGGGEAGVGGLNRVAHDEPLTQPLTDWVV